MAEVESKQGKAPRREEELVEAALAAAAAALLVSGVKKLAPAVLVPRWSWLWWPLPAALPSPVLFLLLNVVIASIVVASVRPVTVRPAAAATNGVAEPAAGDDQGARKLKKKKSKRRDVGRAAAPADVGCCMALVVKKDYTATVVDEQEATTTGDATGEEEVDRRAEEFISAFRHRLRVDSFSSRRRDSQAGGEAAAALATTLLLHDPCNKSASLPLFRSPQQHLGFLACLRFAANPPPIPQTFRIPRAPGDRIDGGGGGEEADAEELRQRGVRGVRVGGHEVADHQAHDRGRLRQQRHPAPQRQLQDPLQGHRVLHQARREGRRRGREGHQGRRDRARHLRRGLRQGRPGHPLRPHPGCELPGHQGAAGPDLPDGRRHDQGQDS